MTPSVRILTGLVIFFALTVPAEAHSAARGFVLLLPTGLVILGGALAVFITFAATSLLPERWFRAEAKADGGTARDRRWPSLVILVVLLGLLWLGFAGPHDPAENLLPLSIWTLWWVVIVLAHPVLGNLWRWINPFTWAASLPGKGPCAYPPVLAYWPALLIFAAFAWFQLVYAAPEDPPRLATVVALYAGLTLLAVVIFGREWLAKADPFALFLSQLAAAAPGRGRFGFGLLALPVLPVSGVLFVLLTLSSISFDSFANTFTWLATIGVNPLDFPGRSLVIIPNSLGLFLAFAALAVTYAASIALGWAWAGKQGNLMALLGRFVYSLIPISISFHFAHYLSDTLVNLQYVAAALNDPLGNGSHLLGLHHFHVTASFQNTASGALAIFTAQTLAVVLGHVVGVAVAHAMAIDQGLERNRLLRLEAPLAAFMVAYTAFGLWLLSTPAIA